METLPTPMTSTNATTTHSYLGYMTWLNLGCNIGIVLCHAIVIAFTSYLMYCSIFDRKSLRCKQLSWSLRTFLTTHIVGSLIAIPYQVYLTAKWSKDATDTYDPYTLLLLGIGFLVDIQLVSVSAFWLTIERCLVLTLPLSFRLHIEKWIQLMTVSCLSIWTAITAAFVLIEIPLNVDKMRHCQSVGCVLPKYGFVVPFYMKIGISFLNLFASCFLLMSMKSENPLKAKNRVIKVTIMMEVILDVLPTLINQFILVTTKIPTGFYIGQLGSFTIVLNVAICSIYYTVILIDRSKSLRIGPMQSRMATLNSSRFNE
ncbi:hypothetical protein DdX_16943 [Ditylenchus destructor]|uniref:Uncharacterized protein n=1 Tax=Ditylenchus destructor TaxID=166010 RepID=A0AAD4MN63_9BILA|nr:hypothetical protein DdX_16943 [Ditylenchus destructor]